MPSFVPPYPIRILVTGFGPFPGVTDNASAHIARNLEAKQFRPGISISTRILPVGWAEAFALSKQAMTEFRPHAVLHFGVTKRASGFEIETRARNWTGPKEDHTGVSRMPARLERYGKAVRTISAPPLDYARALAAAGYPVRLSRDAGLYLCNAIFFASLAEADKAGRPLVSFVHVPALGSGMPLQPKLSMGELLDGAAILVRAAAAAVLRARQKRGYNYKGRRHGSARLHGNRRRGSRSYWSERG